VPGAGHFSLRGLQASGQSASARAGTVLDGHLKQIVTKLARRDHRGWSTHMAALRDKPAKPKHPAIRIFVTSGEIGTNAMHPPGKRSIAINKWQNRIDRRGRTRRSAPTRRICFDKRSHRSRKQIQYFIHRSRHEQARQRDAGWNVERVCREPDISVSGGCKQAHNRRLPGRAPSSMVIINKLMPNSPIGTIADGRPT
jgi:hypothetical protein